jgi:hypothetical protein
MAIAWHNYAAQMNNVPLAPVTTDAVDPAKASTAVARRSSAAAVGTHTWRYIIAVSCVDALRLTCQWGVAMRVPSRYSQRQVAVRCQVTARAGSSRCPSRKRAVCMRACHIRDMVQFSCCNCISTRCSEQKCMQSSQIEHTPTSWKLYVHPCRVVDPRAQHVLARRTLN